MSISFFRFLEDIANQSLEAHYPLLKTQE